MARLEIVQVPVLSDNYVYLAHDADSGATAVVDPAVAGPPLEAAKARGWTITHLLNTHHHMDHVGGNLEVKRATGCTVIGPAADEGRIPGLDHGVSEGDTVQVGGATAKVFEVHGHTLGHIIFWFGDSDALFCGDHLFVMGCGRLTEGTAPQMWASLSKLSALPDSARIYCAHEYTQNNGAFALTVDPANDDLKRKMAEVEAARAKNQSTVPSTLGEERRTNPFLRATAPEVARTVGLPGAPPVEVFAEVRRRKDVW